MAGVRHTLSTQDAVGTSEADVLNRARMFHTKFPFFKIVTVSLRRGSREALSLNLTTRDCWFLVHDVKIRKIIMRKRSSLCGARVACNWREGFFSHK